MPALTIRFTRKPDGSSVLACTRADGTATWQRTHHAFFPLHDLTHYAVETTLGLRYGFYGLLADGWNITDFGERTLPGHPEAFLAEAVVGLLDQERGTGIVSDAGGFNRALEAVLAEMDQLHDRPMAQEDLDLIRARFLALAGRWMRTAAPGEALELAFDAEPAG